MQGVIGTVKSIQDRSNLNVSVSISLLIDLT